MRFVNSSGQPCGTRDIQTKIMARELYKKLGNVWGSTPNCSVDPVALILHFAHYDIAWLSKSSLWEKTLVSLESTRLLRSHKLGVVDEAVAVAVVHLEDGVNHGLQLGIGEQFGGAVGCGLLLALLSQVLALLNVPVDEGLDELEAVQLVVVIVVVQLEVVELQLLLAHLAHVLVGAQHLTQVLLDVRPVLDVRLLTHQIAACWRLGHHARLLGDHAWLLGDHAWLLGDHPLLWGPITWLLWHTKLLLPLLWQLLLLVANLLRLPHLLLCHLHLRNLHLGHSTLLRVHADLLMHLRMLLLHLTTATQRQGHKEGPTTRHPL